MNVLYIRRKPLSLNSAYPSSRSGRRFLTKEGKTYKAELATLAREHFPHLIGTTKKLRFIYEVSGNFLTKKGEVSKTALDLDNCSKLLIDGICDGLGIKDHLLFEISAAKHHVEDEWAIAVVIEEI